MSTTTENGECCPRLEPQDWENRIHEWNKKLFVRDKVKTFFNMPINFGSVMKRITGKVDAAGATMPDAMCLSDHTSRWNMDIFLSVDREIPGCQHVNLSGKFFSKVYEGNFNKTGEWCKDFEKVAKSKGMEVKKWYMWYTTCPQCAKKYSKNYVVIIAKV